MVADCSLAQAMWAMTSSPWLLSVLLIPVLSWSSASVGWQDIIVRSLRPNLCSVHGVRSDSCRRSVCLICYGLLYNLACRTGSRSGLEMKLHMVCERWRLLEAGQFPMFGHIDLLDSSSVLGDVRFEWLYLKFLVYVCLMAVWELRSGWRSLPRPQKLKPGLHACFNWFPRFHYGLIFLEETISMPVIFGPFIDLHYWRFYCKIVELGSQSALGLGESKWASLMVLTSD